MKILLMIQNNECIISEQIIVIRIDNSVFAWFNTEMTMTILPSTAMAMALHVTDSQGVAIVFQDVSIGD